MIPMSIISNLARSIIAALTIVVQLIPIVVLHVVTSTVPRFVVIFASAMLFVSTITIVSKASMAEVFVAGATYSAVLVVFVSGNGIMPSGN